MRKPLSNEELAMQNGRLRRTLASVKFDLQQLLAGRSLSQEAIDSTFAEIDAALNLREHDDE